jgi:ribosomal protein S27E
MARRSANKRRPASPSRCRDCGAETTVPRFEFFKAARPRCPACGGLLEYGGGWQGTKAEPQPRVEKTAGEGGAARACCGTPRGVEWPHRPDCPNVRNTFAADRKKK